MSLEMLGRDGRRQLQELVRILGKTYRDFSGPEDASAAPLSSADVQSFLASRRKMSILERSLTDHYNERMQSLQCKVCNTKACTK